MRGYGGIFWGSQNSKTSKWQDLPKFEFSERVRVKLGTKSQNRVNWDFLTKFSTTPASYCITDSLSHMETSNASWDMSHDTGTPSCLPMPSLLPLPPSYLGIYSPSLRHRAGDLTPPYAVSGISWKQECSPVGCIPPAHYRTGWSVSVPGEVSVQGRGLCY